MSKTNKHSSQRMDNQNYFAPLQTIDNDDDEIVIDDVAKDKVPPLIQNNRLLDKKNVNWLKSFLHK